LQAASTPNGCPAAARSATGTPGCEARAPLRSSGSALAAAHLCPGPAGRYEYCGGALDPSQEQLCSAAGCCSPAEVAACRCFCAAVAAAHLSHGGSRRGRAVGCLTAATPGASASHCDCACCNGARFAAGRLCRWVSLPRDRCCLLPKQAYCQPACASASTDCPT
jgi:hypothetical protein